MQRLTKFLLTAIFSTMASPGAFAQSGPQENCKAIGIVTVCVDVSDNDEAHRIFVELGGGSGIVHSYAVPDSDVRLFIEVNGIQDEVIMRRDGGTRGMNPSAQVTISDREYQPAPLENHPKVRPELFSNVHQGEPVHVAVYFKSVGQYYSNYGQNFHFEF